MKLLFLGGTGAMGAHLVNFMSGTKHEITVTTRSTKKNKGSVLYVTGDAKNSEFLDMLLQDRWDVIVDFMIYSTHEFTDRINKLLASTEQYVYLSSARVYAKSDKPITESSPRLIDVIDDDPEYLASDEYALKKAKQEDILFDAPGKNWTIVRPYITYSEQRLQLGVLEKEDWLYRALNGRTIVSLIDIQDMDTTLTHGSDVARGIASLLGNTHAYGEVFHITASESIKWREVLTIYLNCMESHLGYKPKILLQQLYELNTWRKDLYPIYYDRLYNRYFNNEKINKFISTKDFINPLVGLEKSLESSLTNGVLFKAINWRAEAIKDRMLNERSLLSEIRGMKNKAKYIVYRNTSLQ